MFAVIFYIIDYNGSSLKGSKLLTYLSNLDIPADLDLFNSKEEDILDLAKSYLECTFLVNIPVLEKLVIDILSEYKGISQTTFFQKFIEENKDILKEWVNRIDSLTIYNMSTIDNDLFKTFVDEFPKDDSDTLIGVNFISLIKNQDMYQLFSKIDKANLRNYTKYFNEYMFKGKNLYSYWANENNPLFLLTFNVAAGKVNGEEYAKALKQDEEILNVSPV